MSTSDGCKDGASSKSNYYEDGVCESTSMLQNMSTTDDNNKDSGITNICANCGKEGIDVTNTCNKCKLVRYCNAACKKKHRHKHKKDCEEHLRLAAELHDEALFKQPPPDEDCPICFIRMPLLGTGSRYKSCCGKDICCGCIHAVQMRDGNIGQCPFCRKPSPKSDEEIIELAKKRVEAGDAEAIYKRGVHYYHGEYGFSQDFTKALELWHKAGELGYTRAYCYIGCAYADGDGVEVDVKKATHYWELAAMGGDVSARHNLGNGEWRVGNMDRAIRHFMIAVGDGGSYSLKMIKQFYSNGHATKDVYTAALQAYQTYLGEIKSAKRDEAAAADEDYKYID